MYVRRLPAQIRALSPLATVAAAAALCGCNTLAKSNYFLPGGVDQQSAVASQVNAAEHASGPFPTFSEIPATPNDVRPLKAWRASVGEALGEKHAMLAELAGHPWALSDTEAFAANARSQIPPAEAAAPVDSSAAAEAFAARYGARAKPPPPSR